MPIAKFPHRRNRNGSFDSICTQCFATIANESVEEDLSRHERSHACKGAPPPASTTQPKKLIQQTN